MNEDARYRCVLTVTDGAGLTARDAGESAEHRRAHTGELIHHPRTAAVPDGKHPTGICAVATIDVLEHRVHVVHVISCGLIDPTAIVSRAFAAEEDRLLTGDVFHRDVVRHAAAAMEQHDDRICCIFVVIVGEVHIITSSAHVGAEPTSRLIVRRGSATFTFSGRAAACACITACTRISSRAGIASGGSVTPRSETTPTARHSTGG